jgi:hypothetical protein
VRVRLRVRLDVRGIVYPVGATLPISLILQAGLHGQTANGKPGLSADFFFDFRQEHDASAFGM